jgi:transposase
VVIAIDHHKASSAAAVVDASSQPVATIRVPVIRDGYRALRRFARRLPGSTWAIEGASGLGAPLTARLRSDGWTSSMFLRNLLPGCECCCLATAARTTTPTR